MIETVLILVIYLGVAVYGEYTVAKTRQNHGRLPEDIQ